MKSTNMNSHRILLLALGLVVLGISKVSAATPAPENVEWLLIELNGQAVKAPDGGKWKGATLKLDTKEKLAHGVSFVNLYSSRYDLKDSTLKFGIGKMTAIGSRNRDEMRAEEEYHAMLNGVTGWRITEGKLELLSVDKIVARFTEKAEAKK